MKENGAAGALLSSSKIIVEHESQVVKRIVAPHGIAGERKRQPHRLVIAGAACILAPAGVAAQDAQRHAAGGGPFAIGPIERPKQGKPTRRRAAVALPLAPHDPRRPQRAGNAQIAGDKPAPRAISGRRAHMQIGDQAGMQEATRRGDRILGFSPEKRLRRKRPGKVRRRGNGACQLAGR